MPYKPQGYTSVAPYLIVEDARALIEFLARTFSAQRLRYFERPNGSVQHAEVRIDDTVLMLAESLEEWPAVESNIHIYVPDVDATYARALQAGGESLHEPAKKEDPDRRCGVKAGGINWWIATQQERS